MKGVLKVSKEQVIEIERYCDEHVITRKQRIDELGLSHTAYYYTRGLVSDNAQFPVSKSFVFELSAFSVFNVRKERISQDLQGFSNIEEDNLPFNVAIADVSYEISDNHRLAVGVRNVNEDYFTSPVTSFFTQSSSPNHSITSSLVASCNVFLYTKFLPKESHIPTHSAELLIVRIMPVSALSMISIMWNLAWLPTMQITPGYMNFRQNVRAESISLRIFLSSCPCTS